MTSRNQRVLNQLANLRDRGLVDDFFTSGRGSRLSVWGPGYHQVVVGISNQELFLDGMFAVLMAQAALESKGDQT